MANWIETSPAQPAEYVAAEASTLKSGDTSLATAELLAEVLADLLCIEQVSIDSHVFDDLGADSLVMAHFCARLRKRPDLPSVSMRDVYAHPTLKGLAEAAAAVEHSTERAAVRAPIEPATHASTRQFVVCGALQLLFFLAYAYFAAYVATRAYEWISAASGGVEIYVRAALVSAATLLVLSALPILAKWLLIGRWKAQAIQVWSLAYVRFWIVKTLIRSNPLAFLFIGSALYTLYLRALGAKIGRGVTILSRHVPICTDLLTVGSGTGAIPGSCGRA